MIALPAAGVGTADVLSRTFELSPEQAATRTMGAADAVLQDTGQVRIEQNVYGGGDGTRRTGAAPAVTSVLPAGSRVLADRGMETSFTAGDVTTRMTVRDLPYTDPLARGLYRPLRGRAPRDPGEVTLTDGLAARLSVAVGDTVEQAGGPRRRVVGVVADGSRTNALMALVLPGSLDPSTSLPRGLLVDVPGQLRWADVQRANASGFWVQPRRALPGQPTQASGPNGKTLTAVALVVGMALLEIVLLAGPAFAVGAKRQSRELALLAATGGERRDVRRTVLGSGLVLGVVGGALGVAGGIVLAAVAVPQLRDISGKVPGPFDLRPLELLGLAGVGVLTAVLAAILPARTASRQDVVAALTGRRGQVRSLRRTPLLGALAAVAGAVIALQGAKSRDVNVILAGSAVAELGLVATTPFLVGLVGRLGPWLPLGPRLALRDAARNRGRTAPAVSAVLAAVAGSVAIGTFLASEDRYNEQAYTRQAVVGSMVVPLYGAEAARAGQVAQALRGTMPGADVRIVLGMRVAQPDSAELVPVPKNLCSFRGPTEREPSRAALEAAARDPLCNGRSLNPFLSGLVVGGPAELSALAGLKGGRYDAVLAAGGAVVPFATVTERGTATIRVSRSTNNGDGVTPGRESVVREVVVPAVAAPRDQLQVAVLSPGAARKVALPRQPIGVVAVRDELPTSREQDRAAKAVAALGVQAQIYVERGYSSRYGLGLLALAVGSAVIVLGASGIATGLAAADGRSDLATLAAVGASPGTRRSLAAFQSAVTAGLGTVLGAAAGLVPAVGMVRALNAAAREAPFPRFDPYPLVLPWANLAITVLAVPLLAAGAAALVTRSRLPLVRRLA